MKLQMGQSYVDFEAIYIYIHRTCLLVARWKLLIKSMLGSFGFVHFGVPSNT